MNDLERIAQQLRTAPHRRTLVAGRMTDVITVTADDAHTIADALADETPRETHVTAPRTDPAALPWVPGGGTLLRELLDALPTTDPRGYIAAAAHAQDTHDTDHTRAARRAHA